MEIDVAARRHCRIARMERPPFAFDQPHLRIIHGVAEDAAGKFDLAWREGPDYLHRHCEEPKAARQSIAGLDCFATLAMTSEDTCPRQTAPLGLRKSQTEEALT